MSVLNSVFIQEVGHSWKDLLTTDDSIDSFIRRTDPYIALFANWTHQSHLLLVTYRTASAWLPRKRLPWFLVLQQSLPCFLVLQQQSHSLHLQWKQLPLLVAHKGKWCSSSFFNMDCHWALFRSFVCLSNTWSKDKYYYVVTVSFILMTYRSTSTCIACMHACMHAGLNIHSIGYLSFVLWLLK